MKSRKNTRLRTKTRKRRQTRTRRRRQKGSAKKVSFKGTQKVCKFERLENGSVTLTISYETANIPCEVCLPDETEIMREEIEAGEMDMILTEINDGVSRIFVEDIVNLEGGGFFDVSKGVNNETYKAMVVSAEKLKEAVAQLMDNPQIKNPLPQTIYRTLLKILHQGDHIPDPKIRDMNAALINKMIVLYIKNLTSERLVSQRKGQSSHS